VTHTEFLQINFGKNWVLTPRVTDALKRRYGADVVAVTRKRYAQVEREWRTMYGDPYDTARAALYTALRDLRDSFGHLSPQLKAQADAAIAAELARP
jgi:hypothetical protein